jgi:hypothetical protein
MLPLRVYLYCVNHQNGIDLNSPSDDKWATGILDFYLKKKHLNYHVSSVILICDPIGTGTYFFLFQSHAKKS